MSAIVTLLSDFGTADGYVGEVKGVLASFGDLRVVDISHDLLPHDIDGARLALARFWRRFPVGTVHLVIVDPGVGGMRAALAVESEGRYLVGPDNGVLSPALLHPDARSVSLPIAATASPTFHGRDVFAPAAAQLALGASLDAVGSPHLGPIVRRTPEAVRRADGSVSGTVITIDHFGNAVTNLMARRGGTIELGGLRLPLRRTYGDADPGTPLALIGSSGLVEIAVRDGSAATKLGLRRGSEVVLRTG